jgi:phosphotransferase system  glucose/maltose/N-acetylglucosamine-specific IIC component
MHPPVNITSNSTFSADNSMNYTIRLTHGSAFWTTIFDATGASWSSGPFHAGTNQDVGCLATLTGQDAVGGVMADTKSEGKGGVGIGALAGGVVGAFVAGLVLAALAMMFLAKKKKRSHVSLLSFPSFPSLFFPSSFSFYPCSSLVPLRYFFFPSFVFNTG